MALMCPRCGTEVPTEAQYCPYCSLPRPKRGFTTPDGKRRETPNPGRSTPPIAAKSAKRSQSKSVVRASARAGKPRRRLRVSVLGVAALVALVCIGIYTFVVPMVYSEQAEPKTVLAALDRLRKTPSNEPGLTIDACLSRELETARRVGNLVAYQGWIVRPIKGTKSKVVLAFSYQEVGNVSKNAEWVADLSEDTFTPQTDLAAAVSMQ